MECEHENYEEQSALKCVECDAIVDSDDGPLYECSSCGEVFTRGTSANDNHQCPTCNKFGAKQAEQGCPECNAGELESVTVYYCQNCDTVLEEEPGA